MSGQSFDERSTWVTRAMSRTTAALGAFPAFLLAVCVILAWLLQGAVTWILQGEGFAQVFLNQNYQLEVNTTTTVVTFLMVFVVQNSQNRDSAAIQTKLDALSLSLDSLVRYIGAPEPVGAAGTVGLEDATSREIAEEQGRVREAKRVADAEQPDPQK